MTAVLTVDHDGVVTAWNAQAVQLLGYPVGHAIGRVMDFFIPQDFIHQDKRSARGIGRGSAARW